jgi:phosphonate transport system substrate-binding protein
MSRAAAQAPLQIGTTPVILDEQIGLLARWQRYLEERLDRTVRFVQRGSYREIMDLLLNDSIDVAWVCGYPYVTFQDRLRLLAVPLYQQKPLYRSYLIVSEADRSSQQIADLRNRVFAFSDPRSNSGYLVPRTELLRSHLQPQEFFKRFFFTFGHRKVVEAVQVGLADAGSVDGYVWDTLAAQRPATTREVRVAWRSPEYAFPPIVARRSLDVAQAETVKQALLDMSTNEAGRRLLTDLNIDGFIESSPKLFDGIRALARDLERVERQPV